MGSQPKQRRGWIFQVNASFDDRTTSNLPQTGWQFGTFLSRDEASMNREPSHGVYGNLTVALSQHSVAWVSVNHSLHPAANPVPLWVAGGWISEAHWFDRPQDLVVTGLSYSQYSFVDPYAFETMLEVEYHYAATDWLTLLTKCSVLCLYTHVRTESFRLRQVLGSSLNDKINRGPKATTQSLLQSHDHLQRG